MSRAPSPRRNFRFPLLVRRLRDEIDQEVAFHLDTAAEELIADGWEPSQAREEARRRFGDADRVRRELARIGGGRESRRRWAGLAAELGQDVVFGVRQLRRQPAFTLVALFMLALGIGGSTAIFTALDQIALRPLPFPHAERIVQVGSLEFGARRSVSSGNLAEWRRQTTTLEHLGALHRTDLSLRAEGAPERVGGAVVTPEHFAAFGLPPLLGRTFTAEETLPGRGRVAVPSHRYWRRRFGADRGILGRHFRLDEVPHTVIGVMPAALDLDPEGPDLWVPLEWSDKQRNEFGWNHLQVFGRLRPGVSLAAARAEMDAIAARLAQAHPDDNKNKGAFVAPYADELVAGPRSRGLVFQGAVLFVLLIACANLASLQIARGLSRRRELALRGALGAGRLRIVRQLLTESLVLALLGTLAGGALAAGLLRAIATSGMRAPRLADLHLDGASLGVSLGLAVLSTLLFGLLPALKASRPDLRRALQEGSGGAGRGVSRDRLQRFLIGAEVALALVLLVGAGLLIRSSLKLGQIPLGFVPEGVLTARLSLAETAYPEGAATAAAFERIADEAARIPGVEAAAVASILPLSAANMSSTMDFPGRAPDAPEIDTNVRFVSAEYFAVMGIRLVAGRALSPRDRADGTPVAVINQELARRLWPGENPLGKRLSPFGEPWHEVVGVIGNVRAGRLTAPADPEIYLPLAQVPDGLWNSIHRTMHVALRTERRAGPPAAPVRALERAVASVDPRIPLFNVQTLEERVAGELANTRVSLYLFLGLGGVALLLAVVGIYGVISHYVAQRTAEIALRLALGASRGAVLALMVRQALQPVALGLGAGTLLALGVSRGLAHLLYGVTPRDPLTLAGVVLVLGLAALVAGLDPARRAIRLSSAAALRAV